MRIRIFHPIGQGAFYSENHEDKNIVYDCGEWKDSKYADKVIKQSFGNSDIIDLLFISHFDFDHISKIPTLLKTVKEIKYVILPLLHNNEKILLTNFYRVLGKHFDALINRPQEYFGDNTKILFVEGFDEENNDQNPIQEATIEIAEIDTNSENGNNKIKSGSRLTFKGIAEWEFIPFNMEYKSRNLDLISKLKAKNIDVKKIQNDPDYTLEKIIKDTQLSVKQGGKIFKTIYNSLKGKINKNSMLVYSGPTTKKLTKLGFYSYQVDAPNLSIRDRSYISTKVGCIYTGDSNFKLINIGKIYKQRIDKVGTIQISHHGDIKTFDISALFDSRISCPISFGTNNNYGHPSSTVISQILTKLCFPIFVTEKPHTMYIEIMY